MGWALEEDDDLDLELEDDSNEDEDLDSDQDEDSDQDDLDLDLDEVTPPKAQVYSLSEARLKRAPQAPALPVWELDPVVPTWTGPDPDLDYPTDCVSFDLPNTLSRKEHDDPGPRDPNGPKVTQFLGQRREDESSEEYYARNAREISHLHEIDRLFVQDASNNVARILESPTATFEERKESIRKWIGLAAYWARCPDTLGIPKEILPHSGANWTFFNSVRLVRVSTAYGKYQKERKRRSTLTANAKRKGTRNAYFAQRRAIEWIKQNMPKLIELGSHPEADKRGSKAWKARAKLLGKLEPRVGLLSDPRQDQSLDLHGTQD